MNTSKKLILLFRLFLSVSVFINIYINNSLDVNDSLILLVLIIIFQLNDYIRHKKIVLSTNKIYQSSIILSMIITGYMVYWLDTFETNVFFMFPLIESVLFFEDMPFYLIGINAVIFVVSDYFASAADFSFRMSCVHYICFALPIYLFRINSIEKKKAEKLNKELSLANNKLTKYNKAIEELTISKERNRIAQELHDSLGHSLMALNMNLEYAKKIIDSSPNESKEAITNAKKITASSIVHLRNSVNILREDFIIDNLKDHLYALFNNFNSFSNIKFKLEFDDSINDLNNNIKVCIYKTTKECITNGIKHGKASEFCISILDDDNEIDLIIKNNGLRCDDINKSTGLLGIEERIKLVHGTVDFNSTHEFGFIVYASIPIL